MSQLPSIGEFLAIYDDFRSLEDVKINAAMEQAFSFCGSHWLHLRRQAIYLITAHILTLRWLQTGMVASTAVVQAKGSNATNSMVADNWFSTTVYGQQYLQLRKSIPASGFVA